MQVDNINQPERLDRLDINPGDALFYARIVNTNSLTSFVNTVAQNGNNWVVHIYGDSAAACAFTSAPSPKEVREMLEYLTSQLIDLKILSVELVAFKGDVHLLGSLILALQEKKIDVLEASLPNNLDLEAIKRRRDSIKKLQERFKPEAPTEEPLSVKQEQTNQ